MTFFSESVENVLLKAIDNNEKIMFVLNGELVTIEPEEHLNNDKSNDSLVVVIDCRSQLKASLYRYIKNSDSQGQGTLVKNTRIN